MKSYRFVLLILAVCSFSLIVSATPYWSVRDLQNFQDQHPFTSSPSRISLLPRATDDYALLFEYVQICQFLATMQEPDSADPDFGGMHEGESPALWAIVQTDNTQEAIRIWSLYAQLSGDLETYRTNISRAWIYNLNHRAWNEEGSDGDYYRVHNCGWGLVAEAKYREVYGDTGFLWYADSCAAYMETHRLPYSGTWAALNPLVEGWAAGTLYDFGIEQADPQAVSRALTVGSDVKIWIEADSNRLNYNEVWAMSGGTALWGVCRSVFAADTAAGQAWLPQFLPYLDTYAGLGQWNNSWNAWYAHAWHAAAGVLHDTISTLHAAALVDTLLDADNPVDNDGGIMASSTDPVTEDQSWVSCYLGYMGMIPLIEQAAPMDAAALGFLQPDLTQPVAQGQPVPVAVLVGNAGTQPITSITATVTVGGSFWAQGTTSLSFADVDTIFLGLWTPSNPGDVRLAMNLSPAIGPAINDTASILVHVLGWGTIQGYVRDQQSGAPLRAALKCFSDEYPSPDPVYQGNTDSLTGFYQIAVTEGSYRLVVDPQVPYTDREITDLHVDLGGTASADFSLTPAPVLLVDDDGGASYQQYYTLPLAQAGYDAYWWDIAGMGPPLNALSLFSGVIWFTGNETDSVLNGVEQAILSAYLNTGGNLFLTGQNIAQGLEGQPFLADYLKAAFVSANGGTFQVFGVDGDPVTSGLSLVFAGSGGAGNQNSKDVITALSPGLEAMHYTGSSQPVAAVRVDSPYKLLYLACGLEGATGIAGSTTRQQFLQSVLNWFGVSSVTLPDPVPVAPPDFRLLGLYPNPFNGDLQVAFVLPEASVTQLLIYDALGRQVASQQLGFLHQGEGRAICRVPESSSSGMYFFVLQTRQARIVAPGCLVK